MSKLTLQTELILLLAQCKMWSEQSTYLQNELYRSDKEAFNRALNGVDSFLNHFIRKLDADKKEAFMNELEGITDCMHEGMTGLRKDLLDKQLNETV